ncbi:helix-turn-helix transcriptional regulator [Massilimaliae timonensis]|uniref:Helix-turn-helix transcriptional regulator n=1 Tax=Massiliimalia timonensis TaxID=1987501 RepID=A0A8J6PGD9_9FIRM|nr:helix-turn-helix transcriptional regulator [Massiliimalia timonensis]MBC8612061.1 helix-turn-helix transcriptional regulator [Massiliimalia timonensis]
MNLKLREIRISKGISVPKLVELSGVPRRTIQDIEKRGDCMLSTAYQIACALNVSLSEIYYEDNAED